MSLCHLGTYCADDGHTVSSRFVHEGDASFLAGHLLLICFTLLGQVCG